MIGMSTSLENIELLQELILILIISSLLLYFILAAQFESLIQPLLVILMLPLGVSGSLLFVSLFDSSLNVMSGIGIIVMLGVIVNDAILKIDAINRKKTELVSIRIKKKSEIGKNVKLELTKEAIFFASKIRLKPIMMTSITTILAVLPILFSTGIGADLQKPLVYSLIGGLTVGTVASLFFIPIMYWAVSKYFDPR